MVLGTIKRLLKPPKKLDLAGLEHNPSKTANKIKPAVMLSRKHPTEKQLVKMTPVDVKSAPYGTTHRSH